MKIMIPTQWNDESSKKKLKNLESKSKQEEVIGCLWMIAAILAFGFGYKFCGVVFTIKCISDHLVSNVYAITGAIIKYKKKGEN